MEHCIVCLETKNDKFSRISTASSEWVESKMRNIIEKHLWWWYLESPSYNNGVARWICCDCWHEISAFHRFYIKTERAHRNFNQLLLLRKPIKKMQQEETIFKLEQNNGVQYSNTELKFHKGKERLQKLADGIGNIKEKLISTENIKNELPIISSECDINAKSANTSSLNILFMAEIDENDNIVNEMESDEDEPLVNKRNTARVQNKRKRKVHADRNKKEVQQKTNNKRAKLKNNLKCETVAFDNFFFENQHKLECCICNVPLPDFRSLKSHYRKEHNTRGYSMCCGKKYFKRCLLVDHLKVHVDPNFFKCHLCTKTYSTRRGLEKHLETHKIRERTFKCVECGKSYFKLNVFERHKLIHVPESEKKYNCSLCEKKFASDYLRRQHEHSTHAKKYAKICDICGKTYCHSYSFLRHMEEHAGIRRAKEICDICGVKLKNKYGLRQHMKMRHLEENLIEQICPYCSKLSPNINALRKHIKYTHTMERKHVCNMCNKAFKRPLELKEHLSTHTGEALYTCPHCPRTFKANANMHKHRKIAHRKEWELSRPNKLNHSAGKTISDAVGEKFADAQKSSQDFVVSPKSAINVYSLHI